MFKGEGKFHGHKCGLKQEYHIRDRLPPNASWRHKLKRWFRKFFSPNPDLAITKRHFRNVGQINAEIRRHISNNLSYIIHPYSDMEFYRQLFFLVIATYEIVSSPVIATLSFVTKSTPEMSSKALEHLQVADDFIGGLQIFWIISCFFVGYKERNGTVSIQLDPYKIAIRYITGYFLVDLLIMNICLWDNTNWINLVIIFRCSTVARYLNRFLQDMKLPQEIITCITLIAESFLFIHIFACIFWGAPIMIYGDSGKLWVRKVALHPNKSTSIIYFGCFSMVQFHFWGMGEAKIKPQNPTEQFILIVVMIVGRLWGLYVTASMLKLFTISSLAESKYEQNLIQLQTFIEHKKLPKELGERLLEYYEYQYQRHFFNEKLIFSAMSKFLRQEVVLFRARNVILKVKAFKFFPRSMTTAIIENSKILVFLNNDVIVHAGALMDNIYIINRGTVATINVNGSELIHLTDGDVLGSTALVKPGDVYYLYNYIAIETTEIYVVGLKEFKQIIRAKPNILKFFENMIEERRMLLAEIEDLVNTQGMDMLSELRHERILEQPKIRTRYVDR